MKLTIWSSPCANRNIHLPPPQCLTWNSLGKIFLQKTYCKGNNPKPITSSDTGKKAGITSCSWTLVTRLHGLLVQSRGTHQLVGINRSVRVLQLVFEPISAKPCPPALQLTSYMMSMAGENLAQSEGVCWQLCTVSANPCTSHCFERGFPRWQSTDRRVFRSPPQAPELESALKGA